jgi:hypothetical protein
MKKTPMLLALAAAAALALGACGDKRTDPAPTPAVDPARAPEAAPATPAPPPTAEAAPPTAPTPTPPPTAQVAADAEPTSPHRLRPISLPAFPEQVTAVVATPSLTALADGFSRVARQLGDLPVPADPVAAALEVARMQLAIEDVSWLDTQRPLRLAVPDPKAFPDGFFALIPLTERGPDAVRAAFGERLEPVDGHAGRVIVGGRGVFIDFLGDHLVATSHAPLFEALSVFATTTLLAWTPADLLVLEVSVTHVKRAFATELAMVRDFAGAMSGELTRRAAVPMQAATLRGLIDGAFDFVDHTDRFGFALAASGGRVQAALGLRGVDGSDLAATIARLGDVRLETLAAAAPTSWLGFASHLPRELLDVDRDSLIASLVRDQAFTPEAAGRVADRVIELAAQSTGDSTTTFGADGAFGFALSSVSGVKDGAAARGAFIGLLDLLFARGLGEARAQLGPQDAALPVTSFTGLVDLANTLGGPMGGRLEVVDAARDGAHVSAVVLHVDWAKVPQARSEPALFELLQALIGERLAFAVASGEGRLAFAVGPTADTRAADLAAGRFPGGEPNLTRAGDGAFAAATLRVGPLLDALTGLPPFASRREAFERLPAGEAFVLDARSEGANLVVTFTVPLPLLVALFR